jgi:hypothetical protein
METPAPGPRRPTSATVPLPLGEVLRIANEYERDGRFDDAKRLLDHILAIGPDEPNALHLAGVVAFRQGDPETALELMQRSLEHGIDTPLYLRNLCELYRVLGRLDEALDAGRRAVALAPADPLCLQNQAIVHQHRLELEAALDCANEALRLDPGLPGAHFARAEALLMRGDWTAGFEDYEWRFRIGGAAPLMPTTAKPQWDGRPLPDDTLLLIADQGFGDVVQSCRYIPWAAQRCPLTPESRRSLLAVSSSRTITASAARRWSSSIQGASTRSPRSSARAGRRRTQPSTPMWGAAKRWTATGSIRPLCLARSMLLSRYWNAGAP